MMYPRLRLARNLLREDGVIFIAIDDNEQASLKRLCDEVFGEDNFVATVIWQKVFSPKNTASWFSEDHDYVLVYAREKLLWRPKPLPRTAKQDAAYTNPDDDSRGPWTSGDLTARNFYSAGTYDVVGPTGKKFRAGTGSYWRVKKEKFKALDDDNRIWWGADKGNMPRLKRFLSEISTGVVPQTLWTYKEVGHTQDAKRSLLKYVSFDENENVLNSVKPVSLIQRAMYLAGDHDEQAIILDFFSGSASTAHAVLKQNAEDGGNRRFIAVQIDEPLPKPEPGLGSIFEMGTTRITNVIKELREAEGGGAESLGFRVLKIDSSNMKDVFYRPEDTKQGSLLGDVDHVQGDRSDEDLLFQVLLDWGVDLALPIVRETIAGKTVFFVDGDALAACFEMELTEGFIKELAARKPLRAVFRDGGYASDAAKINAEQVFKALSPGTELRTL